jgi:hypothetical protein
MTAMLSIVMHKLLWGAGSQARGLHSLRHTVHRSDKRTIEILESFDIQKAPRLRNADGGSVEMKLTQPQTLQNPI